MASGHVQHPPHLARRDLVGEQGQLGEDRFVDRFDRVDAAPTRRTAAPGTRPSRCRPCRRGTTGHWALDGSVSSTQIGRPRAKPYRGTRCQRPSLDIDGSASTDRHDPRVARLLPVQGRARARHLRGQGVEPSPAALELLPGPAQPAAADGADGGVGRDGRVDRGAQRGRGAHARVQPHQAAPAPVQHPSARRQELSVPGRHARRGVAAGHGDARPQAQGRRATSAPTPTPTRSATRSICCCARSRSARARRASSTSTNGSAVRACCSTSRSAAARASARSTRERYDELVAELLEFLDGDTDADRASASKRRCAPPPTSWSSSGPPVCATGSRPCSGPSRSSRWWPSAARTST